MCPNSVTDKRQVLGQRPHKKGFLTRQMTYQYYVKYNEKN